jgi:hypothetical protein
MLGALTVLFKNLENKRTFFSDRFITGTERYPIFVHRFLDFSFILCCRSAYSAPEYWMIYKGAGFTAVV